MTKTSDIVPFRRDVWAYHVTCVLNFLWCIACPRRPNTKLLGDPVWCMVASTLASVVFICENRYPSTQTRELYPEMFLSSNQFWALFSQSITPVFERWIMMSMLEREKEREGKSQRNLYMYCNFCRACNITWLLLIKSSDSVVQINHPMYWMGFFLILSLISQYIMEWLVKLLPLFCVILLSLDWWETFLCPHFFE